MFKQVTFIVMALLFMAFNCTGANAGTWQAPTTITADKTVMYAYTSPQPYDLAYPNTTYKTGSCTTNDTWKYYTLIPNTTPLGRKGIKFFTQKCV